MNDQWLSTGQAAQLCSVNPDTVLKWIKRGRLKANRTAGGHYRIQKQDLMALIPLLSDKEPQGANAADYCERPLRCWEYLSRSGSVTEECSKCFIYQLRASWCFQTMKLGCKVGHIVNFGQSACRDCAYYRRVTGHPTMVLVVTADEQFADILRRGKNSSLELCFARGGYEASACVGRLRPAFAVVDQGLLAGSDADLLNSLASDPRSPGLRIILATAATRGSRISPAVDNLVTAVFEKPFGVGRILEVVNRFPVEQMPAGERQELSR